MQPLIGSAVSNSALADRPFFRMTEAANVFSLDFGGDRDAQDNWMATRWRERAIGPELVKLFNVMPIRAILDLEWCLVATEHKAR